MSESTNVTKKRKRENTFTDYFTSVSKTRQAHPSP